LNTSKSVETWLPEQISDQLDFANTVESLAATKKGAIPARPDDDQNKDCMRNIPRLS